MSNHKRMMMTTATCKGDSAVNGAVDQSKGGFRPTATTPQTYDRINNWGISPNSRYERGDAETSTKQTNLKDSELYEKEFTQFMNTVHRPNLVGSSSSYQNLSSFSSSKTSGHYLIDNEKQILEQFAKLNEFIKQSKLLKKKLKESPESSVDMLEEIDNVCLKLNYEKQRYIEFLYKKHEMSSFRDPASGKDSDDESSAMSSAMSINNYVQNSVVSSRPYIEDRLGRHSDTEERNTCMNNNNKLFRPLNLQEDQYFKENNRSLKKNNKENKFLKELNNHSMTCEAIGQYVEEDQDNDDAMSDLSIDALTKDLEDVIKYRDMLDNALQLARKKEKQTAAAAAEYQLKYTNIESKELPVIKQLTERKLKEELHQLKVKVMASSSKSTNKAEWMECDTSSECSAPDVDESRVRDYRLMNNAKCADTQAVQNVKRMDALTLEAMTNGSMGVQAEHYNHFYDRQSTVNHSEDVRLADDQVIEAKVRRLNNASEKLQRLQELVSMVKADDLHKSPNNASLSPAAAPITPTTSSTYAQTKEVAAGSGCKQRMALYNNGAAPKETNRACQTYTPPSGDVNVMLNSARLANLATDYHQTLLLNNADNQTDVNYVEELTGQKLILEGLMKERDDLLALKNRMEFLRNNNNLKMKEIKQTIKTEKVFKKKKINNEPINEILVDDISNNNQVTFQEPLETVVRSNEILYDRMRQQRMLREEVLTKKRELQRFMKLDRNMMYDTTAASDQCSFSTKSDLFGGTAQTQATWGGSTNDTSDRDFSQQYQQDYSSESDDAIEDCYQQVEEEEEEADSDNQNVSFVRNKQEILNNSLSRSVNPTTKNSNVKSSYSIELLAQQVSQLQLEMGNINEVLVHLMNNKSKPQKKFARKIAINKYVSESAMQKLKHLLADKVNNEAELNRLRLSMNTKKEMTKQLVENDARSYIPDYYNDGNGASDSEEITCMQNILVDKAAKLAGTKEKNARIKSNMKAAHLLYQQHQQICDLDTKVTPLVDSSDTEDLGKDTTETIAIETILAKDVDTVQTQVGQPLHSKFYTNTIYNMRRKWKSGPSYYGRSSDSTCGSIREQMSTGGHNQRQYSTKDATTNANIVANNGNKNYIGLSAGISGTSFASTSASLMSSSQPSSFGTGIVNDELFDSLRENIYSEVATLISQNEDRPYYLIELFRELQMLSTDLLRQQALYAIQSCITKLSTDQDNADKKYDYCEQVSTSSVVTPVEQNINYFADESLGETVIHYNEALQDMREYQKCTKSNDTSNDAITNDIHEYQTTDSDLKDVVITKYDVNVIIEAIVEGTMKFLIEMKLDDEEMTKTIVEHLIAYVVEKLPRIEYIVDKIRLRMEKFLGRKIMDCLDDMSICLTESLYNELKTCIHSSKGDEEDEEEANIYFDKENNQFTADDTIKDTVTLVACEVKPFNRIESDEDDDVEDTIDVDVDVDIDVLDTAVAHDLQNEINGETGENITIDDLPNDLVIQIEEETLKNELSNCNLVEIMTPDDLLVGENNLKLNQPENIDFSDE